MKPLRDKAVVVTRPREQAETLAQALYSLGASVIHLPVIEIAEPESWEDTDRAVKMLKEGYFRWAVFTSANAVRSFFARLDAAGLDARSFGRTGVAAVGPATDKALRVNGIRADLVPTSYNGRSLAEALGHGSGRILLPRAADAPAATQEALESFGWSVVPAVCYVNRPIRRKTPEAERVRRGDYDAVTFTSPSAVRAFAALVGGAKKGGLTPDNDNKIVACIGPSTAEAARGAGFRVDAVPDRATAEGLAGALADKIGSRESMLG